MVYLEVVECEEEYKQIIEDYWAFEDEEIIYYKYSIGYWLGKYNLPESLKYSKKFNDNYSSVLHNGDCKLCNTEMKIKNIKSRNLYEKNRKSSDFLCEKCYNNQFRYLKFEEKGYFIKEYNIYGILNKTEREILNILLENRNYSSTLSKFKDKNKRLNDFLVKKYVPFTIDRLKFMGFLRIEDNFELQLITNPKTYTF